MKKHPAPFSRELMPVFAELLNKHGFDRDLGIILDPFAGIGRVHELQNAGFTTIGVELEPEWAEQHPCTRVGNALDLVFVDDAFDAIVTSPTYGNRMADHHRALDKSHRRTYKHYLERDLDPANSGQLQWGEEYREFHAAAWAEAVRVLRPEGLFLLNIKDHQRDKKRAHVSVWHYQTLRSLGLELIDIARVGTPGYRYGENREVRYPERVLVFRNMKCSVAEDQQPYIISCDFQPPSGDAAEHWDQLIATALSRDGAA